MNQTFRKFCSCHEFNPMKCWNFVEIWIFIVTFNWIKKDPLGKKRKFAVANFLKGLKLAFLKTDCIVERKKKGFSFNYIFFVNRFLRNWALKKHSGRQKRWNEKKTVFEFFFEKVIATFVFRTITAFRMKKYEM